MENSLRSQPNLADDLEAALLSFEAAWSRGSAPELSSYGSVNRDVRFLLELAHIDVERRVRAGLPVDVSSYLEVLPELRAHSRFAEELSQAEAELRRRLAAPCAPGTTDAGSTNGRQCLMVETRIDALMPHASGGLGEVFVADDPQLRRRIAVKVLQDRWINDRRAVQSFVAEASVTSQLEHPGIVPVHGVGTSSDGRPCYSMRFVEGETLRDAARALHETTWPSADARALAMRQLLVRFVAVCNTVAYAHSRGVVHRDLKPANILLGKFGETLVLDWGLAKSATVSGEASSASAAVATSDVPDATAQGEVRGTPAYLSPEQADGRWQEVGPATDVFGLGATLYTILTNAAPYGDAATALQRARACDFVAPIQRDGRTPRALDAICRRAMASRPGERYPSALALATDVENWLAGERVVAWPEPWRLSAQRWLRRRPAAAAAFLATAVIVPLAFGIGMWIVGQEKAQARLDRETALIKEQAAAEITHYLVQVFQSADPIQLELSQFQVGGARGHDKTLARMLERGDALARRHLHDQPLIRAGLLNAMGATYCNLGDLKKADELLTESYDVRLREHGPNNAETMESLQSLAMLQFQRGEYDKAETSYRSIRDWRRRHFGADDPRTLRAQFYLAFSLMFRPLRLPVNYDREIAEADRLLIEVLAGQERRLPPNHPDIGHTLLLLASVKIYDPKGHVMAADYAARALEVLGDSEQGTTFGALFLAYRAAEDARTAGRHEEAERKYLQVLTKLQKLLGERHPMVGMYYGNLAGLYRHMKKLDAAEQAARAGLAIIETTPIRSAPIAVHAMLELADGIRKRDPNEADKFYRQALGFARERPTVNQAIIATLETRLAESKKATPAKAP